MLGIEVRISQIRSRSANLLAPYSMWCHFIEDGTATRCSVCMWDFVCRTEKRAYTGAVQEQSTEEDICRKREEMAEKCHNEELRCM